MRLQKQHAVVIGGSMAGLLAARVLAQHFERVTVLERDELVSGAPEQRLVPARKGVPQGRHLHVLLSAGLSALSRLLPDFLEQAALRGARTADIGQLGTLYLSGVLIPQLMTGSKTMSLSRPALEQLVRALVCRHHNIELRAGEQVKGLLGDKAAITGVRLAESELSADLVVDATGRGSRMPGWLEQLGLLSAREELVRSRVTYTSCTIRRRPEHLGGDLGWVITPMPPHTRVGAAQALEGDRFVITLTSYLGEPGPTDFAGMIEYARSLPYPGLYELLRNAEPLSEVVQMQDPMSRRRRYEGLARFPEGLLVFGDALCNFNPAYGQGMSVAALEAEALQRCLQAGTRKLGRRFFAAAAKIVDAPWMLATGSDFQWPKVEGKRPFGTPLLNAYVARVIRTAGRDAVVADRLLRVMHLLVPPQQLFAPTILRRVLVPRAERPPSQSYSKTTVLFP